MRRPAALAALAAGLVLAAAPSAAAAAGPPQTDATCSVTHSVSIIPPPERVVGGR